MNVIDNYKDLEGKTISFAHMAQFADQVTLTTTDGDVLMATFDVCDDEDVQIRVLHKYAVIGVLQRHEYLREELNKLGIFNLEEWKKQQEEEQKKRLEEQRIYKEAQERKEYERLKVKFENK